MEGHDPVEGDDSNCGTGGMSFSNSGGPSVDGRHTIGTVYDIITATAMMTKIAVISIEICRTIARSQMFAQHGEIWQDIC